MRKGRVEDFEGEIVRVVKATAAPAVAEGKARLETGEDLGGTFVRILPVNDNACAMHIYPDYPTICLGAEGHTTEMFGSEERRLEELPKLIRAVIAGRVEWEYRQAKFLKLFRFTQMRGTFHTEDGPWTFTRSGGEPEGAVERRSYEPY